MLILLRLSFLTLVLFANSFSNGTINIISVDEKFQIKNESNLQDKNLVIGVLLPKEIPDSDSMEYLNRLDTVLPGILVGTSHLEKLLPGWRFTILLGDTACNSAQGPLKAVEMVYKHKPDVFLGPVCRYVLAPVARYASSWNIPVISTEGMAEAFREKSLYTHLTCVGGTYQQFAVFVRHLLKSYSWHHVMLLYNIYRDRSKGKSMCDFTLGAVFSELGGMRNKNISNIPFEAESANFTIYKEMLEKTQRAARIIIICAPDQSVRDILLAAETLGMLDTGEYVFFNVDLFSSSRSSPWYNEISSAEENKRARKAFEALMTITAKSVDDTYYENFRKTVGEASTTLLNSTQQLAVNTFVANFHDSLLFYGRALNQTIEEHGMAARRQGDIITSKMWNRTLEGVTGNVTIDENGDRRADFSLLDLDPRTQTFRVVKVYRGITNTFRNVAEIHWPGRDSPPADTPECGFDGSLCVTDDNHIQPILLGVSTGLIICLLAVSVFIYRHYKEEADIASMTWKIDSQDILSTDRSGNRRGSCISLESNFSKGSGIAQDTKGQIYVRTGFYRGQRVALKKINAAKITLNRRLLLDLKRMKDLHNDHLVRFVGACIDPYEPMLVTEYCPRGSLQDILEEEEMNLDWDFRLSLINDIIKGLSFLHASEIGKHGNLKSSNCVVDSRFVLKLTDFGLHELREVDESIEDDSYQYWKRRLWTAPELLNSSHLAIAGTQKGDIYSFAIILHEIAARAGTWGLAEQCVEPKDVVLKIINREVIRPCFNKTLINEELKSLMIRCWSEEPSERPDINYIKTSIKKLNKDSNSTNFVDNLLSRMEQYANNLETLVEERTADYLEEKKKCEDLLYELLPQSVAKTLIEGGDQVIAETYTAVTIYFSDIVGFTSLSAESTPLEIVYFLNDLYTLFDSIIQNFDVYKVETIGDAYMVVSGLPVPNGNNHGSEIAKMALRILEEVKIFKVRHRQDDYKLGLRIGLHTGPVVAGVVGIKMPRYCLFGDTVNTASRMESNGLPLRIHLSSDTADVLRDFGSFQLELRGDLEVKGKGVMTTYWLTGSDTEKQEPILQEIKAKPFPSMRKFERRQSGSIKLSTKAKKLTRQAMVVMD